METPKKYRFTRADFAPLATKPLHLDMVFDITETKVTVTLHTTFQHIGSEPLCELTLNSHNLEIVSVERLTHFTPLVDSKAFVSHVASLASPHILKYDVIETSETHSLVIKLETPVQSGEEFVIRTVSIATPSADILEGLYFDYTPHGAPRTIITQCQQHGFQRIVPCLDTMDAKAYYTVTIVADKNYTNMITNGDLAPGFSDATGLPKFHSSLELLGQEDPTRHGLKYYNHTINMAPYVFFLGVGSYETYRRRLEFPDGDTMLLEMLAFPQSVKPADAKRAVAMLHDSVLWTMVSLGPEACEHHEERKQIYELLEERETLKAKHGPLCLGPNEEYVETPLSKDNEQRLAEVRGQLKTLLQVWKKTGYKYTGSIYREIAMEKSYFKGMENVGNTTIVSACLCASCDTDDRMYERVERTKVHEYYHNINGSQVTGQSPFEMWLNEGITIHMEQKRYAALFGSDYTRLSEVVSMCSPGNGPLAQDELSTAHSVEPKGFNDTKELITAVTYSKAPEFVRMVELKLGEDTFHKALDKYHTDYLYANATSMDWIHSMETFSGVDLQNLAKTWLHRPGHPTVTYTYKYDAAACALQVQMSQTGFENQPDDNNGPWEIPIDWAVVKDGCVVQEGVYVFKSKQETFTVTDVASEPDFFSFARGWSFFGTSTPEESVSSVETLVTQALTDPDTVNKYFAYRTFTDIEKARIMYHLFTRSPSITILDKWVDLHGAILLNEDVSPAVRALTLEEPPVRDDGSAYYKYNQFVTLAIQQAVWAKFATQIEALYNKLRARARPGLIHEQLHDRLLVSYLLALITAGGKKPLLESIAAVAPTFAVTKLAEEILNTTTFVSESSMALGILMREESFF